MSINFEIEQDTSSNEFDSYKNAGFIVNSNSFLFAIERDNNIECIQGKVDHKVSTVFHIFQEFSEKEKIYVRAIKNLMKQRRYLNLMYEYSHQMINDEEFNKELDQNESKYLIVADEVLDKYSKVKTLAKVIDNIEEDLNEEDLTEIFSVENSFVFTSYLSIKNKGNSYKLK